MSESGQRPPSRLIEANVDIAPILDEIARNSDAWDVDASRQQNIKVQRETRNIFLRGALKPLPEGVVLNDRHPSQWTKMASRFPATVNWLKQIAPKLNGRLARATIVALQPGGRVYPHVDGGEYYRVRDRYHLVLSSPGGSLMLWDDAEVLYREGELWWFDNKASHAARNLSDQPRIHLIFDITPPSAFATEGTEEARRQGAPAKVARPLVSPHPAGREEPAGARSELAQAPTLRTLVAGGDVFLGRDTPARFAEVGVEAMLPGLPPLLRAADITLVNLETVVARGGEIVSKGENRPYYFRCPPATLDLLLKAGVTCVTTANNHAGDFGPEALVEQIELLEGVGLAQAGTGRNAAEARRPVYMNANGAVVALLAFSTEAELYGAGAGTPGIFHLPANDAAGILAPLIAEARANADIVVVSPHWGSNWRSDPSKAIRRLAHAIIDAGADAVLGHSAHVLQGVELYKSRVIVYDMSCLLVDRASHADLGPSALFELGFDRSGIRRLVIHPLRLKPGLTRLARGKAAREIRELLLQRSAGFNALLHWRTEGEALAIEMTPTRRPQDLPLPSQLYSRATIRELPAEVVAAVAAPTRAALPADLKDAAAVDMGGGFVVHGQRRAKRVHPGCGFLVEVLFSCPDTGGRHWRASLTGTRAGEADIAFRYRHPVSEGLWHSRTWQGDACLVDAFVAKPPEGLAPGSYRLRWTLVEAESGRIWPAGDLPSPVGWVELGMLEVTADAPSGVAGLDWGKDRAWEAVPRPERSETGTSEGGPKQEAGALTA